MECTPCGICLQSCMVFNSRKDTVTSELNRMSQSGAWNCVNCWKCLELCPQEVDIYRFMMARRRQEAMPPHIRQIIHHIAGCGVSFVPQEIHHLREIYGLKPVRFIGADTVAQLMGEENNPATEARLS